MPPSPDEIARQTAELARTTLEYNQLLAASINLTDALDTGNQADIATAEAAVEALYPPVQVPVVPLTLWDIAMFSPPEHLDQALEVTKQAQKAVDEGNDLAELVLLAPTPTQQTLNRENTSAVKFEVHYTKFNNAVNGVP